MNQDQVLPLIISNIISLVTLILMFFTLKSGYNSKNRMLILFQFGYFGMLLISFLAHMLSLAETLAGSHDPSRWLTVRYGSDIFNLAIMIPYVLYNMKEAKKSKAIA